MRDALSWLSEKTVPFHYQPEPYLVPEFRWRPDRVDAEVRQIAGLGDERQREAEWRDGVWFRLNTKVPPDRLRHAAAKDRKTKRVRSRDIDGVKHYFVPDVRQHWPTDMARQA